MPDEAADRVGPRVRGGPPHSSKRAGGAPRPQRNEPEAAILCRSEDRVGGAQRTEGAGEILPISVGDIATDDSDPAPAKARDGTGHARPEISGALFEPLGVERQYKAGPIGGHGEHGTVSAIGEQVADQADHRGTMEAEGGEVAYIAGEPALDPTEARCPGKDDDGIFHLADCQW